MFELDLERMKNTIETLGIKQKVISERAGISESALCLILQGKRKCEAGEYAGLCKAINVGINEFLKPRQPDETKN